jgi:hypothetical protein
MILQNIRLCMRGVLKLMGHGFSRILHGLTRIKTLMILSFIRENPCSIRENPCSITLILNRFHRLQNIDSNKVNYGYSTG